MHKSKKELLSTVFVLERFNQYTFGKQVMVESDHKPLETIVKKPLANATPRLQRMLLRLQKYDFVIQYKPGTQMYISDMLSRAYVMKIRMDNLKRKYSAMYI